jgi:hypothetical protein
MIFSPSKRKKKVVLVVVVEEVALVKEREAGRERSSREREEEKGIDGVVMVLAERMTAEKVAARVMHLLDW